MFAKKPMPAPTTPSVPPVLHISGPMDRPKNARPAAVPPLTADAPPEPLERISHDAPRHRIAQMIIAQALREGASEITLTPNEDALLVHYLIAGTWLLTMTIPLSVASGLVSAFKTLAGLPIWEHRMALQGLIPVHCALGNYDVHIFITPTRHGEKITMQIEKVTTQ